MVRDNAAEPSAIFGAGLFILVEVIIQQDCLHMCGISKLDDFATGFEVICCDQVVGARTLSEKILRDPDRLVAGVLRFADFDINSELSGCGPHRRNDRLPKFGWPVRVDERDLKVAAQSRCSPSESCSDENAT